MKSLAVKTRKGENYRRGCAGKTAQLQATGRVPGRQKQHGTVATEGRGYGKAQREHKLPVRRARVARARSDGLCELLKRRRKTSGKVCHGMMPVAYHPIKGTGDNPWEGVWFGESARLRRARTPTHGIGTGWAKLGSCGAAGLGSRGSVEPRGLEEGPP